MSEWGMFDGAAGWQAVHLARSDCGIGEAWMAVTLLSWRMGGRDRCDED